MSLRLSRLVARLRQKAHDHARLTVLVLGDSHVRVFEHWWFLARWPRVRWHVEYVPGGTAMGLYNRRSTTQAHSRFLQALADVPCQAVVLNLGEVDTGYTLWFRADRSGQDVQDLLQTSVARYRRFIDEVADSHRLVVLSAPLPTLGDDAPTHDELSLLRKSVGRSLQERTQLTLAFNRQIAVHCAALGVPYLDDAPASLGPNGLVQRRWQHRHRHDHHYDRFTYARWLARALSPHLRDLPAR